MKTVMARFFDLLPRNNKFFYRICKKYVDRYNNENNSDIRTNGELRFIKDNICNCDVVFDVGANVGNWAKLVLGINPNISLHCFEPGGSAFKKLVGNDFPPNVICNNIGLGTEDGERKLFVFGGEAGGNSMYKRKGLEDGWNIKQQATEVIKLTTIDNYCHNNIQKIDLLKIDVEGCEFEVLKGAANLLKEERIKMIQFEYGGSYIDAHILLKDIFEYLENFNYNIFKLFVDDLRLIKRYDQRLENFQYSNYVAILSGYGHI